MRTWFGWLMLSCTLVLIGSYAWTHRHSIEAIAIAPLPETAAQTQATYDELHDSQPTVTVVGPMASYMLRQKPSDIDTLRSVAVSYKPVPSDHVGESPVGTSNAILHKEFAIAGVAYLAFEVPAHAAMPQLHGTYRSFVKQDGAISSDSAANVDFLLLTQRQYGDFLNGHDSEAVFSAENAHDQEVNTSLPPTRNQPAKYYLVFRNTSREAGRKIVQADFRLDF